jgi:nucleoside 2-deoxyribosyltransferase
MSITYCASGFFNETQIQIRDAMVKSSEKFTKEVFRPDSTDTSKEYNKETDPDKRVAMAAAIFKENIDHITAATSLMFPGGTDDIGTLFEVGVALRQEKTIYRYDFATDKFANVTNFNHKLKSFGGDTLVEVQELNSAVLLGFNYDTPYKVYYILGEDLRDNLMLQLFGQRVRFQDSKYYIYNLKEIIYEAQ